MRSKDVRLRLRLRTISDSVIYPEKLSLVKKFSLSDNFTPHETKYVTKTKKKVRGGWSFTFTNTNLSRKKRKRNFYTQTIAQAFFLSWFHTPSLNLKLSLRIKVRACTKMLTNHTHTELVSNSICNYNYNYNISCVLVLVYHLARCQ